MSLTVSSSTTGPVVLGTADNPLYITSTGTVTSSGSSDGVDGGSSVSSWTINNAGKIAASGGNGVSLASSGTITNTGSISGVDAVVLASGGSVTNNAGTISSLGTLGGGSGSGTGVNITGTAGTVTNHAAISGVAYGVNLSKGGFVTNTSLITGGEDSIKIQGAAGTIVNSGTLIATVDDGIGLFNGGSVTNASGASISGAHSGAGIYITGAAGTVTNAGTISGGYHGLYIINGGSISNAASGFITGTHNGVVFKNQAGTLTNSGTISGGSSGGTGVYLKANSSANVTNTSTGTISAAYGIFATSGGTVTNAGSISGSSYAIDFTSSGTNRLIVDPGAVFVGKVKANSSGTNTLELAGGSGTGSISGVGTSFVGFQTLAVDANTTWILSGSNTAPTVLDTGTLELAGTLNSSAKVVFQGSSSQLLIDNTATFGSNGPLLENFVSGDKIDLKGFSSAGASFSYNAATGVLQLSNGSSQQASLEFQTSSLGGAGFQLSSDGASGTLITTSAGSPPPPPPPDNDGSSEPPTLSIANTSLKVTAGGSVSLGITATPADSDDALSVAISGVPTYETITQPAGGGYTIAHPSSSIWTISATAGVSITGLTLTSNYTGKGHPSAVLTVTASNTTETGSASRTLKVTDPPATSTSPTSSTVNTAPVTHLAALFDQFVAAGFQNDHLGAGQMTSFTDGQGHREHPTFLSTPPHHG